MPVRPVLHPLALTEGDSRPRQVSQMAEGEAGPGGSARSRWHRSEVSAESVKGAVMG